MVGDADCTAEGKSLCDSIGVQGFPTIKHGDPNDLQDYKGGRSLSPKVIYANLFGSTGVNLWCLVRKCSWRKPLTEKYILSFWMCIWFTFSVQKYHSLNSCYLHFFIFIFLICIENGAQMVQRSLCVATLLRELFSTFLPTSIFVLYVGRPLAHFGSLSVPFW